MFLLLVSVLYAWAQAEPQGILQGDVMDSRTGRPVERATVHVKPFLDSTADWELEADSLGHFAGQFATGPVELVVSASGYENLRVPGVEVRAGSSPAVIIHLQDLSVRELNSSTISAPRLLQNDPLQSTSVAHLSRDQINNSPGSSQDVNRVLSSLPAVSLTSNDNWNSFVVRGGGTYENIFLLDGIEIANLSHWGDEYTNGGAISMLHLDFVRDLDFYAGGMPAALPPRLSSVTDIRLRDGSFQKRSWQLDLNMAGAGGFAEGPIVTGKSSYMVSGRVSFLPFIALMMPYNGVPNYRNGEAKVVTKLGDWGKLSANMLGGDETISMDNGKDGVLTSDGKHAIGGLEWQVGRDAWSNRVLTSGIYSEFAARQRANQIEVFDFSTRALRLQLKDQFEWYLHGSDIASCGLVGERLQSKELYQQDPFFMGMRNDSVVYMRDIPSDYPDTLWRDTLGNHHNRVDTIGYRIGSHVAYLWNPAPWSVQVGVRDDYYTLLDRHGLSPRIAVTRDLGVQSVSASAGMLEQFPDMFRLMELVDNDSGYALSQIPLQRGFSGALGYKRALGSVVSLDAEIYGKYYDREPRYHINADSGSRDVVVDPDHHWHREAGGVEIHVQKQRQDRFYYELAYSFALARQEYDNGKWYTADDNLRNSAHVILGSRFKKQHSVSTRLDVSEGRPYARIDTAQSLAEFQTRYQTAEGWNAQRRDPVVNLSVRYSHSSNFAWGRVESYMEITNLLNRTYVVEDGYNIGKGPEDGSIEAFRSRAFFFVGGVSLNF